MTDDKVVRFVIPFNNKDINYGKNKVEDLNNEIIYTGEHKRIFNGISDSFKVDIKNGYKLNVCKNQFINYTDITTNKCIRAHFKLIGRGKHTKCSCGSCGYSWIFVEDTCNCEYEGFLDPGKQECNIM